MEYLDIKRKTTSEEVPTKLTKISIEIAANDIRNCCVELVPVHGRPFSLMNDEAFKKIPSPYVTGLAKKNQQLTILEESVKNYVRLHAMNIRKQIAEEIKEVNIYLFYFIYKSTGDALSLEHFYIQRISHLLEVS